MNVRQAAIRLEVSASTIYALVAAGRLKSIRVGLKRGVIRITEDHLAEFMAGGVTIKPASLPAYKPKHVKIS